MKTQTEAQVVSHDQSNDHLLTPRQAAGRLGVTEKTLAVWRCEKRYNLPYIKIGRSVRYRDSAIEGFIDSRTCGNEVEQ